MPTSAIFRGMTAAIAVAALGAAGTPSKASAQQAPVVRVADGALRGKVVNDGGQFLGIPFAAPPVGKLRWMPPAKAETWTGVRDASKFANHCAQMDRGIFTTPSDKEDCLYLNVFTPKAEVSAGAKLPVMVWFYGGGLFSGESDDYDGSRLAKRGNVIVVTFNYRVGALGFLSHPAINAEGHPYANYGIMDQQAALRWVNQNIAAFGGDPGNVTLFGQSGGGTSVMANLASPTAKGLFQRVINQSGTRIKIIAPDTAVKAGQEFAKKAGCEDQTADCLRKLSVADVIKFQDPILKYVTEYPSVDGTIITQPAVASYESGNFNHVPIITGLVQDEQSFFMGEVRGNKPMTADGYAKYLLTYGSGNKAAIEAAYPLDKYESPSLAAIDVAQGAKVSTARMLAREWSKYVPVYVYEFRDRTVPSYYPPMSFPMRAYHTAELLYLFPGFRGGRGSEQKLNAEQNKLSDLMIDYWTSFARTGVPTAPVDGKYVKAEWSKYSADKDNAQYLDLQGANQKTGYGADYHADLWDKASAH